MDDPLGEGSGKETQISLKLTSTLIGDVKLKRNIPLDELRDPLTKPLHSLNFSFVARSALCNR